MISDPFYYDFMKTMNKYVEWAIKIKTILKTRTESKKKITDTIYEYDDYLNKNINQQEFDKKMKDLRDEQERNIGFLYTKDEKLYEINNKNYEIFNLFIDKFHNTIMKTMKPNNSNEQIKKFISEELDNFSDLNRVYYATSESRYLPDILKKIFKHIKDYSESKFYIFRRNIFDSRFDPILNFSSPELSSKNSDFKI